MDPQGNTISELHQSISLYFANFSNIQLLKGGNDNENYSFLAEGKKYVFRIYNVVNELGRNEEEILEEIQFINFFHGHQIPTPGVIKNKEDKYVSKIGDRFCTVFEFIEGDKVYGRLKDTHFGQVSHLMAKIHKLTEENKLTTKRLGRADFSWNFLTKKISANLNALNNEDKILYQQFMQRRELFLDGQLWFTHSDYHFGNILFKDDELSALLDFDSFSSGHFADDIARFFVADPAYTDLNDYSQTEGMIDNFFSEYLKIRSLNNYDKKMIPEYMNLHFLSQVVRLNRDNPGKIEEFRDQISKLREFIKNISQLSEN